MGNEEKKTILVECNGVKELVELYHLKKQEEYKVVDLSYVGKNVANIELLPTAKRREKEKNIRKIKSFVDFAIDDIEAYLQIVDPDSNPSKNCTMRGVIDLLKTSVLDDYQFSISRDYKSILLFAYSVIEIKGSLNPFTDRQATRHYRNAMTCLNRAIGVLDLFYINTLMDKGHSKSVGDIYVSNKVSRYTKLVAGFITQYMDCNRDNAFPRINEIVRTIDHAAATLSEPRKSILNASIVQLTNNTLNTSLTGAIRMLFKESTSSDRKMVEYYTIQVANLQASIYGVMMHNPQ